MDPQTIALYEERASAAERRIAALEQKLESAGAAGGVDVLRYISELHNLKEVLLLAKCEQENLENKVKEVSCASLAWIDVEFLLIVLC